MQGRYAVLDVTQDYENYFVREHYIQCRSSWHATGGNMMAGPKQSIRGRLGKVNKLVKAGRLKEAARLCEKVCEGKGEDGAAWLLLAEVYKQLRAPQRVLQCYRQAVARFPRDPKLLTNYAVFLMAAMRHSEAEPFLRTAANLAPDSPQTFTSLGSCLNAQGKTVEAIQCYEEALARIKDAPLLHSNYLIARQYLPVRDRGENLDAHREWEKRHALTMALDGGGREHRADLHERLRIGYVSADFRTHSIAYFLRPVIRHHDRARFDIYCYANVSRPDAVTAEFSSLCVNWRNVAELSDRELAGRIASDRIDILVDLAGHTAGNRLEVFAARPAPLQFTWLGYPDTTGLSAIDYRITDHYADPVGFEDHYVERLARLEGCFVCYEPPSDSPPVDRSAPRRRGEVIFGSFNNLAKINQQVLEAWLSILRRAPESGLYIKNPGLTDPVTRDRLAGFFTDRGIDAARIRLGGVNRTTLAHLSEYRHVDIALDTFPYNGTTTTCEALWMGVPVLTVTGNRHATCVGKSLLMAVELGEWVADSQQDYVSRAVKHACGADSSVTPRRALRHRVQCSPLCDYQGFTHRLEALYLDRWHQLAEDRQEH